MKPENISIIGFSDVAGTKLKHVFSPLPYMITNAAGDVVAAFSDRELAERVAAILCDPPPAPTAEIIRGQWEVSLDADGQMARVRWSLPCEDGAMFYCRHYPGTAWGRHACQSEADAFNRDGRLPQSLATYTTAVPLSLTRDELDRRIAIHDGGAK